MSEDKPKPAPAMNGGKPFGATPYRPNMTKFTGPRADVVSLAPPQEAEPEIGQGIDLAGQAKIIFAAGRGKTGKTTLLRWLTETSIRNGGAPILADVDPSNATFSAYFADVARPETDNPSGVTAWLQELIEYCINERQSALVDLGGGDTTLRSLAAEMPGLAAHIEAAGMAPVMFHLTGTQPRICSLPSPWPHAVSRQRRKRWCSTNIALSPAQPVSGPLPVSPRRTPMLGWRQIV